jgi:hypothetical protein
MYLATSAPSQYDATNLLLVNPTIDESNKITEAAITTIVTYPLWVGGVQVTANNKDAITGMDYEGVNDVTYHSVSFNEEGSLTFNPEGNVLTMTNVTIGSTNNDIEAPIISGLPNLVININGFCNLAGNENGFIDDGRGAVISIDSEASLVFTSNNPDNSNMQIDCYAPIASGFLTISTANQMIYKETSNYFWVEKLQSPYLYIADGYLMMSGEFYNNEPVEFHYIITGADGVAGTEKIYDAGNSEAIDGPCTIEAWSVYQGQTSDYGKAKNFAPVQSPLRLVYGAEPVDLILAPAIEENDSIEITGIEANVIYDSETGQISSTTMGSHGGIVAMSSTGTTILNNYFYMEFEVVPPTPFFSLEAGSYLPDIELITITGTGLANTTIMYAWNDDEAQEYTEAIPFQEGTLLAWEVYTGGEDPLFGDTATVVYTLARNIEITYASSQEWATYYSTESLTTPEGLTAYIVSSVDVTSGTLTTEQIDYIPMNQAVLLKHSEGAPLSGFTAAPYSGTETSVTNLLLGSEEDVSISSFNNGSVYVLYNDGFTRATKGIIPANRGYLLLQSGGNSRLNIVQDMTTGLAVMNNENEGMMNGVYDLQGRRIESTLLRKGLYIINGKKTIVE